MIRYPVVERLGSQGQRAAHPAFPTRPRDGSHTGNFRVTSTRPPAPSGSFTCLSSTVAASTTSLMVRKGSLGESPREGGPHVRVPIFVRGIRDDTDVEVVANVHALRAALGDGVEDAVYGIGRPVHLSQPRLAAQRPGHRARPVDKEEEAAWVVFADIRRVWHVDYILGRVGEPHCMLLANERLQGGVENRAFPRSRDPAWRSNPLMGAVPGDIMCVGSQRAVRASHKRRHPGWRLATI